MRVEARRLLPSNPLTKIHLLENPFTRVRIAMISDDAREFQNPLGRALFDSARSLGYQIAVKRLKDPNSERKYRRAFAKHLCEWWKPDEAAIDVGVALIRLKLFNPTSFDPRVQRTARKTSKTVVSTFDKAALVEFKKDNPSSPERAGFDGLEDEDEY